MKGYRLLLCMALAACCPVAIQAQGTVVQATKKSTEVFSTVKQISASTARAVKTGEEIIEHVSVGIVPEITQTSFTQTPSTQNTRAASANTVTKVPPPSSLRSQLSEQVNAVYRDVLRYTLRSDAQLDFDFTSKAVAQNRVFLQQYVRHFIDLQNKITAQRPELLRSLGTLVTDESIEFEGLMPASQDVDVIYVGEAHFQANVRDEISQFVSQLRSIYPDRNIILATEFLHVPTGETEPTLIYNREALEPYKAFAEEMYEPLYTALDHEIPILALEDYQAICQTVEQLRAPEISPAEWKKTRQKAIYNFMTSSYGLRLRNLIWKNRIEAIHAKDPSALIVVWGGDRHVNAYNDEALPNLMQAKSFQILFTTPKLMLRHNAFFNGLYTQPKALAQMKALGDNGKIVHWWGKPTPLSQSLGDVTILVADKSTRP